MKIKVIKDEILGGEFLTSEVLVRQWKLILLVVIMAFFYISNRYSCLQKISDINKLKRELSDAKFESLIRSCDLMSESKQSKIQKIISERGVELEASQTPPIVISK
ncbi:MAG: FtsL-like putative cell division protein [Bacteroidales bacterium]|nr:FtsL-like putative cell division protein [Bacteroidales bacterium]MDD4822187.1 FtsL-like putative cell division protein [Bacteroidales bacterium]